MSDAGLPQPQGPGQRRQPFSAFPVKMSAASKQPDAFKKGPLAKGGDRQHSRRDANIWTIQEVPTDANGGVALRSGEVTSCTRVMHQFPLHARRKRSFSPAGYTAPRKLIPSASRDLAGVFIAHLKRERNPGGSTMVALQ